MILCTIGTETSEQRNVAVNAGVISPLVALLESEHVELVEVVVKTLTNIVSGGCVLRDRVLKQGAITPLIELIKLHSNQVSNHSFLYFRTAKYYTSLIKLFLQNGLPKIISEFLFNCCVHEVDELEDMSIVNQLMLGLANLFQVDDDEVLS